MENINVLRKFFKSFMKGDVESMLDCYHENIVFTDQAFGKLEGDEVKSMWRMLLEYDKGDLKISYKDLEADETYGSAKWRAVYFFGKKRRNVINHIESSFKFQDNKIIQHVDQYDMWQWSRQALGWKGYLFGWSNFFQMRIQQKSRLSLEKYRSRIIV